MNNRSISVLIVLLLLLLTFLFFVFFIGFVGENRESSKSLILLDDEGRESGGLVLLDGNVGNDDGINLENDVACFDNLGCDDGNDFTIDNCENPGTSDSFCKNERVNGRRGSGGGGGNNIECHNDNDCDDNIALTVDSCTNPGTKSSQCVNTPIACNNNLDCNDNDGNTEDICQNPGTLNSVCINDPISCDNDNDCNDGNDFTLDHCVDPGLSTSHCTHDPIICNVNSDCGVDGFLGNEVCSQDDVVDDFITHTCNNPGTTSSTCTSSTSVQTVEICSDTCVNGMCETVACNNNNECNDNDGNTVDTCHLPGTVISFCTNDPIITCSFDSECNDNDGLTLDSCLLPGTVFSSCLNVPIACNNNNDCNDNDGNTVDTCHLPGTLFSFCTNVVTVTCNNNNDCNDNDGNTEDICMNPGTGNSFCINNPITCHTESDCGTDNFFGINFCSNENVARQFQDFTCVNPGTGQSSCMDTISVVEVQMCSDECSNGICVSTPECRDGIDNDGNGFVDFPDDPGCVDSEDNSEVTICSSGSGSTERLELNTMESVRAFVNTFPSSLLPVSIPTQFHGAGAVHYSSTTAEAVCKNAGYSDVVSKTLGHWTSCGDNHLAFWNGNFFEWSDRNACSLGNNRLDGLVCERPCI
jgi:hypothetical protein